MHIVHTEASCGWGGQELRILSEAEGMIKRGHSITLLAPQKAKIYAEAVRRGIPVVALPIARKSLCGLLAVRRWLKSNAVDVVNTHSSTDSWLVALAYRTIKDVPPVVRTRHISTTVANNWATRWLYGKATQHVVTTGEILRQRLITENRIDQSRTTSIPTGIDINHFAPGDKLAARTRLNLATDGPLIGCIATLRSWKGHRYLLDAFATISDNRARLIIVGDGPQRDSLTLRIDQLGLSDRVTMAGNQTDVLNWLQALDIFVLPSYANEGVPQALMQAMSCGLPVITTPVGGIPEIAFHEKNALMVQPRDSKALHDAIERLIGNAPLRAALGSSARIAALEGFATEKMLTRMEAVFFRVLQQHG